MRRFTFAFLATITLLLLPRLAAADDEPQSHETGEKPKTAYVSLSVLHLTRPIAEITGELAISPRWSISGIAGAGTQWRSTYWNVGAQILAYPIGTFERGLQLGLEASYAGYAGQQAPEPNPVISAVNTYTIAPVVGFKWTVFGSFAISSQAGAAFSPAGDPGRKFSSLYNLNVGWTF